MHRFAITVIIASAVALTGCQTDPNSPLNKENIGTVLGGIGGAVIGSQFGSGSGRIVAAVVGAGAGAFLGNQLGKSLDEADRKHIAQADDRALTAPAGQTISWRNPDSGASGASHASEPVTEAVAKAPDGTIRTVTKTPKLSLVSGQYVVKGTSSVNVRAEPNTLSAVVGILRTGEAIDAVGKVVGSDWMLVARDGQTVGYVAGNLISPTSERAVASATGTSKSSTTVAPQPTPFKLVEAPVVDKPVAVATVTSQPETATPDKSEQATCRTVTRTVQKNGESAQEKIKYCKTADGWQKVEA